MKLSNTAISSIKARTPQAKALRLTLALSLNFTTNWVDSCLKANKENGPLTTEKALRLIEKSTGLDRSQILEEDEAVITPVESRA